MFLLTLCTIENLRSESITAITYLSVSLYLSALSTLFDKYVRYIRLPYYYYYLDKMYSYTTKYTIDCTSSAIQQGIGLPHQSFVNYQLSNFKNINKVDCIQTVRQHAVIKSVFPTNT